MSEFLDTSWELIISFEFVPTVFKGFLGVNHRRTHITYMKNFSSFNESDIGIG